MKVITALTLSLVIYSSLSIGYGQISIPLLQNDLKCIPCKDLNAEEEDKIDLAFSAFFEDEQGREESLATLHEFANDSTFSKNARIVSLLKLIDLYAIEIVEENDVIYNLAQSELGYEDDIINEAEAEERIIHGKNGAEEICLLYAKAIMLSTTIETTKFLQKRRLDYIINSDLINEIYVNDFNKNFNDDNDYFPFEALSEINNNAIHQGIQHNFYSLAMNDFIETNYYPYNDYMGLSLGFTSIYGKDLWIGGEFSVDAVANKNPFQIINRLSSELNYRTSNMGVSYMKNLRTNTNDLAFFPSRITNLFFLNFNLLQFGFQWGDQFIDNSKYWFYRPEIGISYGIFSLTYGYNAMFNKSVRDLTEKSIVSFKISYPLIKVGR